MKILAQYIIIFLIVTFSACKTDLPSSNLSIEWKEVKLAHAKGFKIFEHENLKRIDVLNPIDGISIKSYVLYKEQIDSSLIDQKKFNLVRIPITKTMILSLDTIGYLDLIKQLNSIIGISDTERLNNSTLKSKLAKKEILNLGMGIDYNVELVVANKPDIIFNTFTGERPRKDVIVEKSGITVAYNFEWMEETPLARAEWVKFFGLFYDNYLSANQAFKNIEKEYNTIAKLATSIIEKPTVLLGADYQGTWFTPGGKSFKAKLLSDAGADYCWKSDSTKGSIPLSFELVFQKQINSDFWIEVPFENARQMAIADKRYTNFHAYKVGNMFNFNRKSSSPIANEYWETSMSRPDILLKDLIEIFHPGKINHDLYYFKKLER